MDDADKTDEDEVMFVQQLQTSVQGRFDCCLPHSGADADADADAEEVKKESVTMALDLRLKTRTRREVHATNRGRAHKRRKR